MKALNAKNLEALGSQRLAELLIEIAGGNAGAKQRLRLELAGAQSPGELAKEVSKRLAAMARARSFLNLQGVKTLVHDLDVQRQAIQAVAKTDPREALELLWKLMALATPLFGRCDDSNGTVSAVFHHACIDIGGVASGAKIDATTLADRAFECLLTNNAGQFGGLIQSLAPPLGRAGLERLKSRMIDLSKQPVKKPAVKDRVTIGWSSSGPIYQDDIAERSRRSIIRTALMDIADALGDVDAFIEQYDQKARKMPNIAAGIAQRLVAAGRAQEAWQTVEAAEPRRRSENFDWPDFEWEDARIGVLDALGRTDDAQAARWACFERSLSQTHLRAYLKRLPDFDDVVAEKKALDHVQRSPRVYLVLSFLVSWPALDRAAHLVLQRSGELGGNDYEVLTPAINALAGKYPLAATVALRAMIDFTLTSNRTTRYKHAARHLRDCAGLSAVIENFGAFEIHEVYETRLRRQHGKKSAFWNLVG